MNIPRLRIKYQLKQIILIFLTKFGKEWCSLTRIESMNVTIEFNTFHLFEENNFNSNKQFQMLEQNLTKKDNSSLKLKK